MDKLFKRVQKAKRNRETNQKLEQLHQRTPKTEKEFIQHFLS